MAMTRTSRRRTAARRPRSTSTSGCSSCCAPACPTSPSDTVARGHRRGARATPARWRADGRRTSRTPSSWRSAASSSWPAAAAPPTPAPRSPRRSRAPTRSAAARPAAAGASTRCSRPTGSAPGWPGGSSPRPRSQPGSPAETLAEFAELVFAYIDELSAASVAGHTDELATPAGCASATSSGWRQQPARRATPSDRCAAAAERADWAPPTHAHGRAGAGAPRCGRCSRLLEPAHPAAEDDLPGLGRRPTELAVLLVPDARRPGRRPPCCAPARAPGIVGPARPWAAVRTSYERATARAATRPAAGPTADRSTPRSTWPSWCWPPTPRRSPTCAPGCSRRWRRCAGHRRAARRDPAPWLLHQGRRDDVAAALFVHPQTVRYRMGQLRELYGDRLDDPETVLDLTIALAGEQANGPCWDDVAAPRTG